MKNIIKRNGDQTGLILALCLSATIKTVVLLFMRPFNSDGVLYITAAQSFAAGNFAEGFSLYPMPFYSLLLALAHFLVPHWEISAKLLSMACVIFAAVPLYRITADLFNPKAAFWAALAFSVAPLPNDWAVDIVRGPVFVFFFLWAVFFAHQSFFHPKTRYFLLSAVFAGLAALLRIEGTVLPLFFPLFWLFQFISKQRERRVLLKGLVAWMAVLVIFSGACLAAASALGHGFNRFDEVAATLRGMTSGDFLESYHRIYDQLKDMEESSVYSPGRQNFAEIARHFMALIYLIGLAEVFVIVLFPLFLIPLFAGLRRPLSMPQRFLLFLAGFYLLVLYALFVERDFLQRRFLFAPAVLFYPFIGRGLEILRERCFALSRPRLRGAVFLVVFMIVPVFKTIHSVAKDDNVLRDAGTWMAENPEAWRKGKVLVNDVMAPFFAGLHMREYLLSDRSGKYDFSEMEKWALQHDVTTLVLKLPNNRRRLLKDLSAYRRITEISGKKRSVYIYGLPETISKTDA